jgi:anti-sigma B factor antagonist
MRSDFAALCLDEAPGECPPRGDVDQGAEGVSRDATCVTHFQGQTIVHLRGELDMATAPLLAERLACVVGDGPSLTIIDVSQLAFCDSSGLGVLLRCRRRTHQHGGQLVLRSPSHALQRLLTLTGLDEVLETEFGSEGP